MVAAAAACLLDIKDEGQNPPTRAGEGIKILGDSGASSNTRSFDATGFALYSARCTILLHLVLITLLV